ncbi:hypothetical protein [Dyadobacter bucti]|uniref:hypothetical protein n=1 Tax=Dyadobacter bucti TaxID=2572203 RepID=UPI0011095CED|nr:hypothetical protein [Dyadobacter bucti]
MAKNYSLAAHLIHSGLQMIWKRLNIQRNRSAERVYSDNQVIFKKVAASLIRQYGIEVTFEDYTAAAEMLIFSLAEDPVVYYQVMLSTGHTPRPVSSPDGGVTIVDADPSERMTHTQAEELMHNIWKHRGMALMHIRERFARDLPQAE